MQAEGVMAAAKHFPGHGDTAADTHWETPTLTHSLERTQAIELYPFREAIAGGSQAVLTAHVLFEALDPNNPATISSAILTQLLRQEMGFAGLTITDAMDMYAVARLGAVPSIRAAINAGADVIMMGHLPDQFTMHAQVQDIQNTASVERIQAARRRIPRQRPPLGSVGNQAHQAIAQEIADKSITLVRGENLPLKISPEAMIAVITPHPEDLTPADTSSKVRISLPDAIRRRHPLVQHIEMSFNAPENQLTRILQATESADVVIMGTIAADVDASQANLVREIYARGQNPVVVALRTPYDLSAFPMIQNYLCAYSIRPVSMEATARVLFGEIEAQGVLPCAIPGITVLG
jgi:beta-N-acetylhexosaminidase